MRNASWMILLVACSGSSTSQQPTVPTNPPPATATTPPPSTPEPTTATPPSVAAAPGLTKDVCGQRKSEFGPIALRDEQVGMRRGSGVKTFADVASSQQAPIEVCMVAGEHAWLKGVTCTDGSAPSNSGRSGSVGMGGACNSIIDLYMVTCPEKQYEVYMDMYMCPPGKGM